MTPFDPTSAELRPLAEYSERLPSSRRGKRVHRATLWRWALKGTRGGVLLPTVRLGGCRYTCDASVAEFMRRLSEPVPRNEVQASLPSGERDRIRQRFDLPEGASRSGSD